MRTDSREKKNGLAGKGDSVGIRAFGKQSIRHYPLVPEERPHQGRVAMPVTAVGIGHYRNKEFGGGWLPGQQSRHQRRIAIEILFFRVMAAPEQGFDPAQVAGTCRFDQRSARKQYRTGLLRL